MLSLKHYNQDGWVSPCGAAKELDYALRRKQWGISIAKVIENKLDRTHPSGWAFLQNHWLK
jgi:hypothetical protein